MWTIFARKSKDSASKSQQNPRVGDVVVPDAPPVGGRITSNPIATIEHMGPTAVATLTVTELSQTEDAAQLAGLLDDLSQSGAKHFVLDVQNVQHMDSACVGCLVKALNGLAAGGGRIALVNPDHSIQYLFRMTQLDRMFPICHDVMGALAAVERGSP